MTHNLKITAAIIIIISMPLIMLSCSKHINENNNEPSNHSESVMPPESGRYVPDLPDSDFNGYKFRAVTRENPPGTCTFNVEEENGDVINDAIYKRNRYIEDKFNVVFEEITLDSNGPLQEMFRNSVLSDSDDFDICLQINVEAYTLAVEGFALSADKLPYVDITQPWYLHDVNEAISVGNKNFIVYGDDCLSQYESLLILCFNKQMVSDLDLETPYDFVNSGSWTYDNFFNMCRAAAYDLNGDGKMTDEDRYGAVSYFDHIISNFWVCAGVQTVIKDSEGMLVLNMRGNEKLFSVLANARQNILGGSKILFDAYVDEADTVVSRTGSRRDIPTQLFENNLSLFYSTNLHMASGMRAMETDFGIVPFPKENERQGRYYTRAYGGWPQMVPSNASNPERTSIILEALAAESKNTTLNEFKEKVLTTKVARDDESSDMLDIIFNSVVMELGDFMWRETRDTLINEVYGDGNFVSAIEENYEIFVRLLDTVNDSVKKSD